MNLLPFAFIVFAWVLLLPTWATGEPPHPSPQRVRLPSALWHLNAAGQLVLRYDPFGDRTFPVQRVHTVVLTDRAPKLCGDPDGTGRHTWFFTDAMLIETTPWSAPPDDKPASINAKPVPPDR
ncbi:hypothetical protein [Nitrospina gracilis]|uniref:hypothetical protein n=1 Tax=Nitrospina gracilis TaxID=35801 RepID=UPI001F232011|nr:hypothetical protein [Nitrospina gracilis]MCF8719154.1 hypothetical protein [Nitrospina gracilis Nb-211]